MFALAQPFMAGARPVRRLPSLSNKRSLRIARAGSFDESAAQVRRLVDRDRKELDYDALQDSFKSEATTSSAAAADAAAPAASSSAIADASTATRVFPKSPGAAGDSGPMSPFGPSSSSPAVSPFGAAGGGGIARKPFAEPAGLRPDLPPAEIKQEPWWTKITLVQIVLVLSFTTIIGLMLATTYFVFQTGAIHFNE